MSVILIYCHLTTFQLLILVLKNKSNQTLRQAYLTFPPDTPPPHFLVSHPIAAHYVPSLWGGDGGRCSKWEWVHCSSFCCCLFLARLLWHRLPHQLQSLWGCTSSSVLSPALAQVASFFQKFSCFTVCPASLSCFSLVPVCASLMSQYQLLRLLCLAFILLWHFPSVSSCVSDSGIYHSEILFCRGTRDSSGSILVHGMSVLPITDPAGTKCTGTEHSLTTSYTGHGCSSLRLQ